MQFLEKDECIMIKSSIAIPVAYGCMAILACALGFFADYRLDDLAAQSCLLVVDVMCIYRFIIGSRRDKQKVMDFKWLLVSLIVFTLMLSGLISFCFLSGRSLQLTSVVSYKLETLPFLAYFFCLLPLVFCCLRQAAGFILAREEESQAHRNAMIDRAVAAKGCETKKICIESIILILIPQITGFILLYPGIYGYDGAYHILQIVHPDSSDVSINKGYSVLYTLFLGGLVSLGKLGGNIEMGFATAMFLQALIACLVKIYVTFLIYQMTGNRYIAIGVSAYFGLNPHFILLQISSCQDVFFGCCFLLVVLESCVLIRLRRSKGCHVLFQEKIHYRILLINLLLLMLFRNNGLYVVAIVGLVALLLRRYVGVGIVRCAALSLIAYFVISGPVYSMFGVQDAVTNSPVREISSIPSQQFARVYVDDSGSVSQDDRDKINRFYDSDFSFYWDLSEISDSAKGSMDIAYTKQHLFEYAKLWASLGIGNPSTYAQAFQLNTLGYWYIGMHYPDARMYHPLIEYKCIDAKSFNPDYADIREKPTYITQCFQDFMALGGFSEIPILGTIVNPAIYFWINIVLFCLLIITKRWWSILPCVACIGLYATLLLSPVCLFRYCYPILLAAPMVVVVCFERDPRVSSS